MLCPSPPEILVVLRKLNLEEIRAENPVNFIRIAAISLLLKILILKLLNFSIFNSLFLLLLLYFSLSILRVCHRLKFSVYLEALFPVGIEYIFVVQIIN